MKKTNLLRCLFAMFAVAVLGACGDDPEVTPTPPPQADEPVVTLTAGEATIESLSVTISSQHAEEVKWLVYSVDQAAPDTDAILRDGTAVEPNRVVEVSVENLPAATTYGFVAVAVAGELQTVSNRLEMTTLEPEPLPEPTIALEFVAVAETTATIRLISANAEQVKWISIKKGSRDLRPEQVLQHGTSAEVNTTAEVTIEELEDDTEYEIHAVAAAGEVIVAADKLEVKTLYQKMAYEMSASEVTLNLINTENYTNFYLDFSNSQQNCHMSIDLYASPGSLYFPTGDYPIGAMEPGNLSSIYTKFTDSEGVAYFFTEGLLSVMAVPNEKDRTITYKLNGEFQTEAGDAVTFSYRGMIDGLSLPATGIPDGYIPFEVEPANEQPRRIEFNDEVPGQYTLKFTDKDWGVLTLDILLDPAVCDNGNAALPAGTYSIEAGTMSTYTNVSLYNPYWSCYFSTCEVEVSCEGEIYTIVMLATGTGSGQEKKIWMNYTGEIQDMVRQ